jgi:hypothetical protein
LEIVSTNCFGSSGNQILDKLFSGNQLRPSQNALHSLLSTEPQIDLGKTDYKLEERRNKKGKME